MMSDPRDYRLEIGGASSSSSSSSSEHRRNVSGARPYLSVLFACCRVYQRIYRSPDGTHYAGRCPRCGQSVRFLVGAGGTSERFFVVE